MKTQTLSDKEIDQKVTEINTRLKAGKVGVRVERRGSCLSLVATLPPRPSSKSKQTKPHQQRIALKLLTNPKGLKQAEEEAKLLGARLATRQFDWAFYRDAEENTASLTCGEWVEKFKFFILSTIFSEEEPEVAALLWRRRFYDLGLSKLDSKDELTLDAPISAAQESKPNSRSRQLHCQNLQRLANFAKVKVDLKPFSGNYSPKDAKPREIPNDVKIEENREKMKTPGWKWVYGYSLALSQCSHTPFAATGLPLEKSCCSLPVCQGTDNPAPAVLPLSAVPPDQGRSLFSRQLGFRGSAAKHDMLFAHVRSLQLEHFRDATARVVTDAKQ